MIFSAEHTCKG